MSSRGPLPKPGRRARSHRSRRTVFPPLDWLDAAVAAGAVADLRLALDRLGGLREHRREPDHALALGAELQEALLDLGAEVDTGGNLVGDRVRVEVEVVDLGLGRGHDTRVGGQALLDLVLVGRV